ncbi:MAG: deoxyhypusine synthase [Candidatus Thermoplasmatota archaeon]
MPKPVRDIRLRRGMSTADLVRGFSSAGGFTAAHLAAAADILKRMLRDKGCTKFLSFPGCIVATGTRGVIAQMLKERMVDVVITTCGAVDHDLARIWKDYYHGSFDMNDIELRRKGVCRLGNVLIPNESYGTVIESRMRPFLEELWDAGMRRPGTKELLWALGSRFQDKGSILYWAWKNQIPIYVPGITDGAVGSQLWLFSQERKDLCIDLLKDERELAEIIFNSVRTGALVVGGGISKHHTIWWNQFRDGLDYAIYISTAVEYDGSLSGARTHEAISWGKISERARHVNVEGDATILLPLLVAAVMD